MSYNIVLGARGEKLACKYLKHKGYKIIETNFRCKLGEIDIIAEHRDTLVFVEVKTRTGDKYGLPQEAITNHKKLKIKRTAQFYMASKHIDMQLFLFRFDCIALVLKKGSNRPEYFRHIKNIYL
ncbi:YraN family protein [Clostridium sp. 'deep sea']|uniref:YraN family protein n=1 Tax=Clostridium sp. 'deep sea' TaxID=2779445 RepID=UPI0018965EEC|nr:YraN family protein [Clostridium sp. 'deep sea']QOR36063.1 YraN family protein [Clostridium sp. 'deep sea']